MTAYKRLGLLSVRDLEILSFRGKYIIPELQEMWLKVTLLLYSKVVEKIISSTAIAQKKGRL